MFKWLQRRRRQSEFEPAPRLSEVDRDSGEEEYESQEEESREESPGGLTRLKTDEL
jgi:hypothetical protein